MTNKELLEIIKIAKENKVNTNTFRIILKATEQDGKISSKKVKEMKSVFKREGINDKRLLAIFEKSVQKDINLNTYSALSKHELIKNYLSKLDFDKHSWKIVLEFVSKLPINILYDSIYVKWLRYLYEQNKIESYHLEFFHELFWESINTPLIHSNWYFTGLLSSKKPINMNRQALSLIKQNLFNLEENATLFEMEEKAKKIVKCLELYDYEFTKLYATVMACVVNLDVPVIENDLEKALIKNIYNLMCYLKENTGKNFINSLYYSIATNKEIDINTRLEFTSIINNKRLVLKNELIHSLWNVYLKRGKEFLIELKQAFLNNGIRTNILCKSFLLNEQDLDVLKKARIILKNNRVRKDTENLCILCDLKTSAEKLEFLSFLESKYQDTSEYKRKKEKERKLKETALLKTYKEFLSKKIGLQKLEESLTTSHELELNMERKRQKR